MVHLRQSQRLGTRLARSIGLQSRFVHDVAEATKTIRLTSTPSRDRMNMNQTDRRYRTPVTNQLWAARNQPVNENGAADHAVLEKTMADSYTEAMLLFSSDDQLRDDYLTYAGTIRVGKLLEDLDALSGTIAYCHCDDNNPDSPPLTIVTASVDRIDLLQKLHPDRDYRLSGHVAHVGSSSMEINVLVESPVDRKFIEMTDGQKEQDWELMLMASFTFVAKDSRTGKAHKVNRLIPRTDDEVRIFDRAGKLKDARKERAMKSLDRLPPSEEERLVVHDLFLQTRHLNKAVFPPEGMAWMTNAAHTSIQMCHPQDRNIHNSVFGGFLMREAFELGWMTASMFSNSHPFFLSMDDTSFRLPVPIGAILRLNSKVTYTQPDSHAIMVDVTAEVVDVKTGEANVTNIFHFTFTSPNDHHPQVLPKTYEEAMLYLDGRRRLHASRKLCEEQSPHLLKYY